MNNTSEENNYRAMLLNFRICDLRKLLKAFGKYIAGRRLDLQNVALDILNSKPIGLNYEAYLIKIHEIHNDQVRSCMLTRHTRNMTFNMNHNTQILQQRNQKYYINPIEAKYNPRNAMAINNIQPVPSLVPSYQPIRPSNNIQRVPGSVKPIKPNNAVSSQFPSNEHNYMSNMMTENSVRFYLKTKNNQNIPLTLTPEIVAQYKFKTLPFYEVQEDIIKPTLLISGSDKCSITTVCEGTRECMLVHTMSVEQATLIGMNRNISYGQNKYLYQYQIRFCQLELGHSEVTDFLPKGLHIRIGNRVCKLPPTSTRHRIETHTQVETTRRIAGPIDCTQLLKLNPTLANHITINWLPDEKTYAVAVFLVKKLSPDDLINKLLKKESRSKEDTINYIIKKLEDLDPDFATTSYHVSLLCPLSKSRMTLPAKSIHCDHLQCFDAEAFILMNDKKPTWKCPTCRRPILYEDISIEIYFLEIVRSPLLQENDEEIKLLADGSWTISRENKYIKNTNGTLNTEESTISIDDLDENDDEIATKPKKELVPENSVKQELIDVINVDDNDDEIATEPKIDPRPEGSVMKKVIDVIDIDDSDDEIATEPKIDPRPEGSVMKKVIDVIDIDDSDDEIATEPKIDPRPEGSVMKKVIDVIDVNDSDDEIATEPQIDPRPEGSVMQKVIDVIDVDDSDDEIATEPKIDPRPKGSVMQKVIDVIDVDDSDDEIVTEPKIDPRPKGSVMQKVIDVIDVDDSDDEIVTEPKIDPRPEGSEKQESKNLKSHLIDLTINEDEEL